jgi:hypothetical protein
MRTDDRRDDVYVVTAFHVVADADRVTAMFPSKAGAPWELALQVVREDPANDVALLRGAAAGHALPRLALGTAKLEPGETLAVYGYPDAGGALAPSVDRPVVARVHGPLGAPDVVETNAENQRDGSGSPALDSSGRVIGMLSRSSPAGGAGVVVPAIHVRDLFERYVAPDPVSVAVPRRIRKFVLADESGLSNALSSHLVMEVLPVLNASLADEHLKRTALRQALVDAGLPSAPLTADDQDRLLRPILSDDENAALLAERIYDKTGSLRAAVATYFRALAQRWLGVGDTVAVAGVRLILDDHALGALAVTARDVVVLRVVLTFVFERGSWKIDELLVGPAGSPALPDSATTDGKML